MLRPATASVRPAPGARALYLGASGPKRVGCTDEALVISNARAQTFRYPVARVARVVSSPVVDWSGAALALCLRRGIPIAWLDPRGQPLGTAYPQARGHTGSAGALELLLETPEGECRYQHWLRARRLDVLLRTQATGATARTPAQWESVKRAWVYAGECPAHLPPPLRAHALALVAATLARHGLPPTLWGPQAQRLDLDEDLCELLWAEMNLGAGNLADSEAAERPLVELFDRWAAANGGALLAHVHSLQRLAQRALVA